MASVRAAAVRGGLLVGGVGVANAVKNLWRNMGAYTSGLVSYVVTLNDVDTKEDDAGVPLTNWRAANSTPRSETFTAPERSIRTFSGEDVTRLGISRPADIAALTPGLNAKYSFGTTSVPSGWSTARRRTWSR